MENPELKSGLFRKLVEFGGKLLSPFPYILLCVIGVEFTLDILTYFIGFFTIFITGLTWIIVIPFLWVLNLSRLVYSSFRSRIAAIALSVGLGFFFLRPTVVDWGGDIYLLAHKSRLDHFVDEIQSDRSIYHLTDFQRYSCKINEIYCNEDSVKVSGDCLPHVMLQVADSGVDTAKFVHFVKQLRSAGLIEFKVFDGFVDFCYDGFLDNSFGFICVTEGNAPSVGMHIAQGEIASIEHISGRWYKYSTS